MRRSTHPLENRTRFRPLVETLESRALPGDTVLGALLTGALPGWSFPFFRDGNPNSAVPLRLEQSTVRSLEVTPLTRQKAAAPSLVHAGNSPQSFQPLRFVTDRSPRNTPHGSALNDTIRSANESWNLDDPWNLFDGLSSNVATIHHSRASAETGGVAKSAAAPVEGAALAVPESKGVGLSPVPTDASASHSLTSTRTDVSQAPVLVTQLPTNGSGKLTPSPIHKGGQGGPLLPTDQYEWQLGEGNMSGTSSTAWFYDWRVGDPYDPPHVPYRVIDFSGYGPFAGGMTVAFGDYNGDGTDDIGLCSTTTDLCWIIDGISFINRVAPFATVGWDTIASGGYLLLAQSVFDGTATGGVFAAFGRVNDPQYGGDVREAFVVGTGYRPGLPSQVRAYRDQFSYHELFVNFSVSRFNDNGATVAVARVPGYSHSLIVAGTHQYSDEVDILDRDGSTIDWFQPTPGSLVGVYVAAGDLVGSGYDSIMTGTYRGNPLFQVWAPFNHNPICGNFAYEPDHDLGATVAVYSDFRSGDIHIPAYLATGSTRPPEPYFWRTSQVLYWNTDCSRPPNQYHLEQWGSGDTGGVFPAY